MSTSDTLKGQTETYRSKSCTADPPWQLQPVSLGANLSHRCVNSDHDLTTTGGCTQRAHGVGEGGHTWSAQVQWVKRLCHWTSQDTYYIRPLCHARETQHLYLIHRNKHRDAAKMRRQRNMSHIKEQNKTPEIKKQLNEWRQAMY